MTDWIKITGAFSRTPEAAQYMAVSKRRLAQPRISAPGRPERRPTKLALGSGLQSVPGQKAAR